MDIIMYICIKYDFYMLRIGKFNNLRVVKTVDFGV